MHGAQGGWQKNLKKGTDPKHCIQLTLFWVYLSFLRKRLRSNVRGIWPWHWVSRWIVQFIKSFTSIGCTKKMQQSVFIIHAFVGVFQNDPGPPKHALELRDYVKDIYCLNLLVRILLLCFVYFVFNCNEDQSEGPPSLKWHSSWRWFNLLQG